MEAYKLSEKWKQFYTVLLERNIPVDIIEDTFQELLKNNYFYNIDLTKDEDKTMNYLPQHTNSLLNFGKPLYHQNNNDYLKIELLSGVTQQDYDYYYPIGMIVYGEYPKYIFLNYYWIQIKKTIKQKIERPFVKFYKRIR